MLSYITTLHLTTLQQPRHTFVCLLSTEEWYGGWRKIIYLLFNITSEYQNKTMFSPWRHATRLGTILMLPAVPPYCLLGSRELYNTCDSGGYIINPHLCGPLSSFQHCTDDESPAWFLLPFSPIRYQLSESRCSPTVGTNHFTHSDKPPWPSDEDQVTWVFMCGVLCTRESW